MEPDTHVSKTQNDAAPTNRAASFVIPLSPTEDSSEDMLQASSRDCADAWSGIEPPDDDDAEAIEPGARDRSDGV